VSLALVDANNFPAIDAHFPQERVTAAIQISQIHYDVSLEKKDDIAETVENSLSYLYKTFIVSVHFYSM